MTTGNLFVEYPFLDLSQWAVLAPKTLLENFSHLATQIAIVIDYLHMLGLVHCDLKLDNFLYRVEEGAPRIVMLDLDFLSRENADPKGRVLGTPDHIAPEILDNDRIVIQSDIFSLGVSLDRCLKLINSIPENERPEGSPQPGLLAGLVKEMTQPDHLRRPRHFLEALHRHGLLDDSGFESGKKTLLAMLLLTKFRTTATSDLASSRGMEKFLRRDSRILGPGDEFIKALATAFGASRRKTLGGFKNWLRHAAVYLQADYWHVGLEDADMLAVYRELHEIAGWEDGESTTDSGKRDELKYGLERSRKLESRGYAEFAYLYLKNIWDGLSDSHLAVNDKENCLRQLVAQARSMNRLGEMDRYLEALVELRAGRGEKYADILYERARINFTLGKVDTAGEIVASRGQSTGTSTDKRTEIKFQRLKAWSLQLRGEYDASMEVLERCLEAANRHDLFDVAIHVLYTIGVLHWRQGDFRRSDEFLVRSYELAEERQQLDRAIPVISTISRLAFEQADYVRAVKFGKLALKIEAETEHRHLIPWICGNIANAEVRQANFPKAEYWQQRYLSLAPSGVSTYYMVEYYLQEGFLRINQGDVIAARDSFYKGLHLLDPGDRTVDMGKALQNLAEAEAYQGRFAACEEFLSRGRSIYEDNGQEAGLAELGFIRILNDFYSGTNQDAAGFIEQAVTLREKNCRYFALLSLFHGILNIKGSDYSRIQEIVGPLKPVTRQHRPPLFKAMSSLLEAMDRYEGEDELPVTTWKGIFAILLSGRQKFLAMMVGIKIADLYTRSSNAKHAKKFLQQSLKLAEGLGNDLMAGSLKSKLQLVSRSADNTTRLIQSFHGISEILTNLGDYRESLHRLIKFAVDQTGAERGVIFLKTREGADLSVAASLNCDDQSLSDIKDFSMNVPQATMRELAPLIIENALDDRRTNQYESIVYHNILSVICVPLANGKESLGALYLDHHTIPALFDKEDLTFISSVANFISVALATARDIRSQLLTNLQMQQDLRKLGDKQTFVTRDSKLLELFNKLPQIAATRAPVLVLGENGTGKEIVGHMIHQHSPRQAKPLVKLNCAAIPETLIESELFGVAKNVATGVTEREGRFAAADSGTLYLDEIGDMPQTVQAKVLRVLEYQEFEKVGGTHPIQTDIRFIYATNKNLKEMVATGQFREDLFYRINTITIEIPPLRERVGDVPALIDHFVLIFSEGKARPEFSTAAMEALTGYHWPGNVRELKNLVERYCILYPGTLIKRDMLPPEIAASSVTSVGGKKVLEEREAERLQKVLVKHDWNQTRAGKELKMPLSTLRRKMKKYRIRKPS